MGAPHTGGLQLEARGQLVSLSNSSGMRSCFRKARRDKVSPDQRGNVSSRGKITVIMLHRGRAAVERKQLRLEFSQDFQKELWENTSKGGGGGRRRKSHRWQSGE